MKGLLTLLLQLVCALWFAPALSATGIYLQAPTEIIQGYPALCRVIISGPARVERMSLEGGIAPLQFRVVAEKDGACLSVGGGSMVAQADFTSPSGRGLSGVGSHIFYQTIQAGETVSYPFDAESLFTYHPVPEGPRLLNELAPGRYRATVTIWLGESDPTNPSAPLLTQSQEVAFTLLDSDRADWEFLLRMKRSSDLLHRWGNGVTWKEALFFGVDLTACQPETVSARAQLQMGLHALMIRFLSGRSKRSPWEIASAQRVRLPPYLEPERELLLIELRQAENLSPPEELREFYDRHPDMRRRVDGSANGSGFVAQIQRREEARARRPEPEAPVFNPPRE